MNTFQMSELLWDERFIRVPNIDKKYLLTLLELKLVSESDVIDGGSREYIIANSRTHKSVLNVTVAPAEADDFLRFQKALIRSKTTLA